MGVHRHHRFEFGTSPNRGEHRPSNRPVQVFDSSGTAVATATRLRRAARRGGPRRSERAWGGRGNDGRHVHTEFVLYRRIDLAPPDAERLLHLRDETLACLDSEGNVLDQERLFRIGERLSRLHREIATAYGLDLTKCGFSCDPSSRTAHIDYPLTDKEEAAVRGLG